jgi:hypothetical protein
MTAFIKLPGVSFSLLQRKLTWRKQNSLICSFAPITVPSSYMNEGKKKLAQFYPRKGGGMTKTAVQRILTPIHG